MSSLGGYGRGGGGDATGASSSFGTATGVGHGDLMPNQQRRALPRQSAFGNGLLDIGCSDRPLPPAINRDSLPADRRAQPVDKHVSDLNHSLQSTAILRANLDSDRQNERSRNMPSSATPNRNEPIRNFSINAPIDVGRPLAQYPRSSQHGGNYDAYPAARNKTDSAFDCYQRQLEVISSKTENLAIRNNSDSQPSGRNSSSSPREGAFGQGLIGIVQKKTAAGNGPISTNRSTIPEEPTNTRRNVSKFDEKPKGFSKRNDYREESDRGPTSSFNRSNDRDRFRSGADETRIRPNEFSRFFSNVSDSRGNMANGYDYDLIDNFVPLAHVEAPYVPKVLPVDELFSDDRRIAAGEHFDQMFGGENEIQVSLAGRNVGEAKKQQIKSFSQVELMPQIMENINRAGYQRPTPIQAIGIPLIMAGHDIMAHAQTGSGKTAAFLIPLVQWVCELSPQRMTNKGSPYALIVSPVRELTMQLYNEARKIANGTRVGVAKAYGGYSVRENVRELQDGCDIVVATPGRLLDFVEKGLIQLHNVQFFVLDEGDRLFEHSFLEEVDKLLNHPDFPPLEKRQTMLFSATFNEQVQQVLKGYLRPNFYAISIGFIGAACETIQQKFVEVKYRDKRGLLMALLQNPEWWSEVEEVEGKKYQKRTLIFIELKRQTDSLAAYLSAMGVKANSIHGDRPQRLREFAVNEMINGNCPVLVTTDVCARGLDIKGIEHVINFDMPRNKDTYVHRIGRTGRAGNAGIATTFVDPSNDNDCRLCGELIDIVVRAHQEIPDFMKEMAGMVTSSPKHMYRGGFTQLSSTGSGIGFAARRAIKEDDDEGWN